MDDKQALSLRPADIVEQTIAYRKKYKDKLDRLKREAEQEARKGPLKIFSSTTL